jgi:hypothetical protein
MAVRRDSLGCLKGIVYVATYVETVDLEQLAMRWLRLSGPVFRVFKWKDCSVVVVAVGM